MLKKVLFQTHWLLGITLGIVLSVVGVTGAMLSFEHEILHLLNPGMSITPPAGQPALTPAELAARVKATAPDRAILSVGLASDLTEPVRVQLAPRPGEGGRGETRMLNPYTGEQSAGPPAGQAFFRLTMQIHRWLAGGAFGAQDVGKQIVALSTVACLIFCVTGLYLRWPRKPLDWRVWLALDLRRKGRALLWHLHIVVGTWLLVPYIVMSLTGLTWSYEWWRNALTDLAGAPRVAQMQAGGGGSARSDARAPAVDLDAAWGAFRGQVKAFEVATIRLPGRPGQPVQVQYRDLDPPHERANNTLTLDPATWAVTGHRRYADLPLGQRLVASFFPLHSGSYFGTVGLVVFMLSSLAMPFFAVTGWIFYLARRKRKKAKAEAEAAATENVAA
jgi:sulfite reductase (NADPH) flavoprotein alpha-component